MNNAAAVILKIRTDNHLTQQRLASLAGVSPARISEYETGKRNPTVETLRKIVAATGASLDIRVVPSPERRHRLIELAGRSTQRSMAIEGKEFVPDPIRPVTGAPELLARLKRLGK